MLNVLYNEHTMTDSEEKEMYLAFLKESVALDRALLALRTIEEKEAIDIVEAEIRCMEESGDINTLENYYREAADEAADKKEGIISKVWEFIKDMLNKIKEFLIGSKQSKKLDEDAKNNKEYAFDDEGEESFSYLKKITYALKGGEGGIKNLFKDKKTWAILAGTAALTGGAVALTVSKNKHKASEVKAIKDDIVKYVSMGVDKIKEIVGKVASFVGENAENLAKKIVGFLNKAKSWLFSILNISQDKETGDAKEEKNDGNPNKRADDLDPKTKGEFKRKKEALIKKYKGKTPKAYKDEFKALLDEYGLVKESVDELDDLLEESVEDVFDIPEFLSEESVEDIDDISSLLESL